LGAKLLDRVFHRLRQVSPPVDNLTHRFFDGSQHVLYCDFTVGSRHSVSPLRQYLRTKGIEPQLLLGDRFLQDDRLVGEKENRFGHNPIFDHAGC